MQALAIVGKTRIAARMLYLDVNILEMEIRGSRIGDCRLVGDLLDGRGKFLRLYISPSEVQEVGRR